MKLVQAFRFRVYPSEGQLARLGRWEGALRFLWNLAHEQRLRGLDRPCGDPRKFYSAEDQMKELTELRAQLDWLSDVPCDVCQQLLKELDKAWQRFFLGLAERPQFKKKGRDSISLCEPHQKAWRLAGWLDEGEVTFPKLGPMPAVVHRPWPGQRKTATLVRDVDQWFISVVVEQNVPEPVAPLGPVIGLDRGVSNVVADSQGARTPRPAFLDEGLAKIAKARRAASKKQKGSNNKKKANLKVARRQRKLRRQQEHLLHTLSHHYARNHRVVVIEDLQLKNMAASAKGTAEQPGQNVAQKAGLNRAILTTGLGKFARMLGYKAERFGSQIVEEPAAYSSQECAACHHVDAANRRTQSEFCCAKCGHQDHADNNAARVLVHRYEERKNNRRTGGGEVCGGDGASRPLKQKLRVVRRGSTAKDSGASLQSSGLQAGRGLPGLPVHGPPRAARQPVPGVPGLAVAGR